jgi:hypothetical protein
MPKPAPNHYLCWAVRDGYRFGPFLLGIGWLLPVRPINHLPVRTALWGTRREAREFIRSTLHPEICPGRYRAVRVKVLISEV